jgi:hypothetical protein
MSKLFGGMEDFGAEPQKNKPAAISNDDKSIIAALTEKSNTSPKKEEYVLVKLNACWADEFNVCHAWAMTREDYDEGVKVSKENLEKRGRHIEIYFGTNEALDIDDFDDYMNNLSVHTISKEDYEAFNRMFYGSFGMMNHYFPYGDY